MERTQQKVELTGQYLAKTPDGEQVTITERTTFIRERSLSEGWTPWIATVRRLSWGNIPVNPREDGDWETAEYTPRKLTRLR